MLRGLILFALLGPVVAQGPATEVQGAPGKPIRVKIDAEWTEFGRYYAILIAVGEYDESDTWPALASPRRDADALARVLSRLYGFTVDRELVDEPATYKRIRKKLNGLGKNGTLAKEWQLSGADSVLVYFSGHGYADGQAGKPPANAWWIPSDGAAKVEDSDEWVNYKEVTNWLSTSPAGHVLVIADCCFAGAALKSGSPTLPPPDRVAEWAKPSSAQALCAGGNHPVDGSSPDGTSRYTFQIVETLKAAPRYIHAAGLHDAVAGVIKEDTAGRQQPRFGPLDIQSGKGQFVFWKVGEAKALMPAFRGVGSDGVPLGWRLPAGFEAVDKEKRTFRSKGHDGCEMVLVEPPKGNEERFPFGNDPSRQVWVHPFLIDRDEVTNAQFERFIATLSPALKRKYALDSLAAGFDKPDQPVVNVKLEAAIAYALWADKILPREEYWEYAAAWDRERGDLRPYPCASPDKLKQAYPPTTLATRQLGDESPWGVYGMCAGVREWCFSSREGFGVVRGGYYGKPNIESIDRNGGERKGDPKENVGFRCMKLLEPGR